MTRWAWASPAAFSGVERRPRKASISGSSPFLITRLNPQPSRRQNRQKSAGNDVFCAQGRVGTLPCVCRGRRGLVADAVAPFSGAGGMSLISSQLLRFTAAAIMAGSLLVAPSTAPAQSASYFRTDTPAFRKNVEFGYQMFTAYQCAKCHAIAEGQALNDDIVAPNLILSKSRLRPEWILDWLIAPQKLQPGTKMPAFFNFNEDDDGKPILSDPDAHAQYKIVVALRDYLMVLGTELDPGFTPGTVVVQAAAEAPAEPAAAEAPEEVQEFEDFYGY
jgi:cytochrome c2